MAGSLAALTLCSTILAAALPAQVSLSIEDPNPCVPAIGALRAEKVYCGTGVTTCDPKLPTKIRISNGAAGLSGLIGYLADIFIDQQMTQRGMARFKIEWIKGDTTETIGYLETGQADIGITYNKAAECQAVSAGVARRREYGFRDHFYLVGPKAQDRDSNPAGLEPMRGNKTENILQQMQKIVRTGNNPGKKPTRFLSRYDKSATNIKDAELFVNIGQVPWGLAYSKWYHQYTMYPIDALQAASLLQEYTITDRGTWLSTEKKYTDELTVYNQGSDNDPKDLLLMPAFFLNSAKNCAQNAVMSNRFVSWVISQDGQDAISAFRKPGSTSWIYTSAPTTPAYQPIKDCNVTGV